MFLMTFTFENKNYFSKLTSHTIFITMNIQYDSWGWTPSSSYKAAFPGSIPGESIF